MTSAALLSLPIFLLASAAAASSGIVFRGGDWYQRLAKPAWRPPDRLFGPVWLVLYICIAVAGWLVWRQTPADGAELALGIYAVQLVLNALWSFLFFGLRRPDWACVEILFLWLSIIATIVTFHPVDPVAAYLLVPYAVWVSFAVALNASIWRLNRQASNMW